MYKNLLKSHPNWPAASSFDERVMIILIVSTTVICLYLYLGLADCLVRFFPRLAASDIPLASIYPSLYNYAAGFLLLGLIPMLTVRLGFRESLSEYGLQIGDWRFGLPVLALGMALFIIISYASSLDPAFQAEYPLSRGAGDSWRHLLVHEAGYGFYYFGFEFLFRGFMLFGLRQKMGDWNAILIQTLASTLIHIGKPFMETLSAILGGIIFGVYVLRCRSIYYQLIWHWTLGTTLNLFIVLGSVG